MDKIKKLLAMWLPNKATSPARLNKTLGEFQEIAGHGAKIYNQEIAFKNGLERSKYAKKYKQEKEKNQMGLISDVRFQQKNSIPTFYLLAAKNQAKKGGLWHNLVLFIFGKQICIFDPNYDPSTHQTIRKMEFATRIIEFLKMLRITSKSKFQIYICGGGNTDGTCRTSCFKFIRDSLVKWIQKGSTTFENFIACDYNKTKIG